MTDEQIERIQKLSSQGFSTRDITRYTGLPSREIHRVRTGKTLFQTNAVLELRQERPPQIPPHKWERLIYMNFYNMKEFGL